MGEQTVDERLDALEEWNAQQEEQMLRLRKAIEELGGSTGQPTVPRTNTA